MRFWTLLAALLCCFVGRAEAALRDKVYGPVTLTDGSTIAVDASSAASVTYTLTLSASSHTISNPTSLRSGEFLNFIITQGGSGGFTPLWDTQYTFPNGTPVYNTAAAAVSIISCVATSTSVIQCLGTVGNAAIGANPTASIGTAAVNGTATTWMRSDAAPAPAHVPTFQRFTSGSASTYTTPANARELVVTACGAGAGGGGTGGTTGPTGGNTNGTTTFNSINAAPGSGGVGTTGTSGGAGGAGGTGGTGSASYRINGQAGGTGYFASGTANGSPPGGLSGTGGDGRGGAGAVGGSTSRGGGGSGGGGECFVLYITSPSGTYTYTVGTAGTGGVGTGTGAVTGSAGTAGSILVEEYY